MPAHKSALVSRLLALAAALIALGAGSPRAAKWPVPQLYEYEETRELVTLVNDAAKLVRTRGEAAFDAFRVPGSRWRQPASYIFVLDPQGNMVVHPDPSMEGRNALDLKDITGKHIIRGIIDAATSLPEKPGGWYHYQWLVPGGILPRWKSTYVRLVSAPSGKSYLVAAGMYNDRMERVFRVDAVTDAVGQIEMNGEAAFPLFRDPTGRFIAKNAYIFVLDPSGVELVNPAFPTLEGRNLLEWKDARGKQPIREMLEVAETHGSGWVDYLWPRPGESVATPKSAYVSKARIGDKWVLVGSGVYLAGAPRAPEEPGRMSAPALMTLVREGAALLESQGEQAHRDLRTKGSKWRHDDLYFFVWTMDGIRVFDAADPALEGQSGRDAKDMLGRPYGQMFLSVARTPSGEGWVHYMYPEPDRIFPAWKSTFVKRVTLPSGEPRLIGAGVYHLQMNKAFIEDVVDRAAALVAERGKEAFDQLRDEKGPFFFMDTYVFVDTPDGTEVVNPAYPSLEGRNIIDLRDTTGKLVAREYIDAAMKHGSGWVEYHWYRPGHDGPQRKLAYVRKVQSGQDTYIVGSGVYVE